MNAELLREILVRAEAWPAEDRAALANYARIIDARRTGRYVLDDDEKSAGAEALEQADRSEFANAEALLASSERRPF